MAEQSLVKLNNFQQRLLVGIVGGLSMLFGIAFSQWFFLAVFFLICLACTAEFYKLLRLAKVARPNVLPGMVLGIGNYLLSVLYVLGVGDLKLFLFNFPIISLLFFSELYRKKEHPFVNIAFTLLGLFYVALPFSMFVFSAFPKGEYRWQMVVGYLFVLWANDSGAYFCGKAFGKRKLFERVSPNKTWEGSLGGLLLAILFALGFSHFFDQGNTMLWLSLAGIIVVTGSLGDLVESLFKRSIAIKDSGSFIPGHGGFLDRFDALILSLPFVTVFLLMQ